MAGREPGIIDFPPARPRSPHRRYGIMSNAFLEHFGRACGLTGPLSLLVTKLGDDRPVRYQLAQPFALVGRASQTDVQLDHSTVSRRHAYLQAVGGRVLC